MDCGGTRNVQGLTDLKLFEFLIHMDKYRIDFLWLQERVQSGELRLEKVWGHENVADLMTKYVDAATILRLAGMMNMSFVDGRSEIAPRLHGH